MSLNQLTNLLIGRRKGRTYEYVFKSIKESSDWHEEMQKLCTSQIR